MGQVAFYAAALKPYAPAWLIGGFFALPVSLVVLIHPGEVPARWVSRCHSLAAGNYVLLTVAAGVLSLTGYEPEGSLFYHVLMHLGWLQFAPLIRRYFVGVHYRDSDPRI